MGGIKRSQRQELKSTGLRRLLSSTFVIHVPGYIMGKLFNIKNLCPKGDKIVKIESKCHQI